MRFLKTGILLGVTITVRCHIKSSVTCALQSRLPLYSVSEEELLWILSALSIKSSEILDARLPGSWVGWQWLEYGAQAASGLQSAKISLMRNEDVTVLGCEPPETCPPRWRWESSPRGWACLCTAASTHSRLGEGGDEQPLPRSEPGLSSSGDLHSAIKLSPLDKTGLPGLWDSKESIPKLEPLAEASISKNCWTFFRLAFGVSAGRQFQGRIYAWV